MVVPSRASRTSIWIVATSIACPSATANGNASGATAIAAATAVTATRPRRFPPPSTSCASVALTVTTANVTPQTPATVPSRTVARLSTCETPIVPHVNPPSGHMPLHHSSTVHAAAMPITVINGRPGRRKAGTRAPNSATQRAETRVRATHAISPKRRIQ